MDQAHPTPAQTAVVLGGTGFLGRAVCRALAGRGYAVVAVARHDRPVALAAEVVALDLADADVARLTDLLGHYQAQVVVNAAGGMWGLSPEQLVAANTTLTEHVITATGALPHRARLIHVGTVHEYGLTPIGTVMHEDMVAEPVTEYGSLKLECTRAVLDATRAGDVDGVVLRIGNVTGAGQPAVSLLGVVARQLAEAARAKVPAVLNLAPLGSQRDFVSLNDAVGAIVAAAQAPSPGEALLNIGTGRATSAREMVRLLTQASGVPTELVEKPAEQEETVWQCMAVDRAREVLGWTPSDDLAESVRDLWQTALEPEFTTVGQP